MGIEELKRHLEARARADAKAILEEGHREAEEVQNRTLAEARAAAAAHVAIVQEAERRARGAVVQASRDGSRTVGAAYEDVVLMAVDRAIERLSGLTGERYLDFITRSLAAGDRLLGTFVVTATRERDVPLLESEGRTVDGVEPGAGGIIMRSPDGRVLDLRFESIVDGMRDRTWQTVVGELGEVRGDA